MGKLNLHNGALTLGLWLWLVDGGLDSRVENSLKTFLGKSGTFHVGLGVDFAGTAFGLVLGDHGEALSLELLEHVPIVTEIGLGTNEDNWDVGSMVLDFWPPLGLDVVKGVWGNDGETDEEDIGLWVGEWAKTIVIFLTGGIPEADIDRLPVNHDVGVVVVEDSRDVLTWESVGGIGDEEAGLADGTITDNNTLDGKHA